MTRYNYVYRPDFVAPGLPLATDDPRLYTGEPSSSGTQPRSHNSYDSSASLGQDKLLSYTRYLFDTSSSTPTFLDAYAPYTVYEYMTDHGKMSRRFEYDGGTHDGVTRRSIDTRFRYDKERLSTANMRLIDRPLTNGRSRRAGIAVPRTGGKAAPFVKGWPSDVETPYAPKDKAEFHERYAYNIFGDRIGILHCAIPGMDVSDSEEPPDCKGYVRIFDYVDGQPLTNGHPGAPGSQYGRTGGCAAPFVKGQPLTERTSDNPDGVGQYSNYSERLLSVYTWGPTGLIARRGVSIRNGFWYDLNDPPFAPEPPSPTPPNPMCDYEYLADIQGNVRGLIDRVSNQMQLETYDAFGNLIGSYALMEGGACATDFSEGGMNGSQNSNTSIAYISDYDDGDAFDSSTAPEVAYRMQGGRYHWRGGEGSQTDFGTRDQFDGSENHLWAAQTHVSTGLVFMQARYYDPAVGRFTQSDRRPYDISALWGQNNRWVYCANDPVNGSDVSGKSTNWTVMGGLEILGATLCFASGLAFMAAGDMADGLSAVFAGIAFFLNAVADMETDPCVAYWYNKLALFFWGLAALCWAISAIGALANVGEAAATLTRLQVIAGAIEKLGFSAGVLAEVGKGLGL